MQLKQHRNFGRVVDDYFAFFKENFKPFANIFFRYNGIFLLALLGVSYMMVTGFMGIFQAEAGYNTAVGSQFDSSYVYVGFAMLLYIVILLIVGAMNYSLASSYIIGYESGEKPLVGRKVRKRVSKQFGKIFVFMLLFIALYVVFAIVGNIVIFIPVLGILAYYLAIFIFITWAGVAFMAMLHANKPVMDSFSEAWKLMKTGFWKAIGANFIILIILYVLSMAFFTIPGIVGGFVGFHIVDNGIDLFDSAVFKILIIVFLFLYLTAATFMQSLQQLANGVLYFTLHEETYRTQIQARIAQIGTQHDS